MNDPFPPLRASKAIFLSHRAHENMEESAVLLALSGGEGPSIPYCRDVSHSKRKILSALNVLLEEGLCPLS